MTTLTLFVGDTDTDVSVRQILNSWSTRQPNITLHCESVHMNPAAVVRLGITELPALVTDGEIIAQGPPEYWVPELLSRIYTSSDADG
jgi:hypothetical protein